MIFDILIGWKPKSIAFLRTKKFFVLFFRLSLNFDFFNKINQPGYITYDLQSLYFCVVWGLLWKLEVWNVWEMMAVDFIAFWDSHIIYGSGISKWVGLTWLVLMSVGLWSFKKLFTFCKFCSFYKTVLVSTNSIAWICVLGMNEETKRISREHLIWFIFTKQSKIYFVYLETP